MRSVFAPKYSRPPTNTLNYRAGNPPSTNILSPPHSSTWVHKRKSAYQSSNQSATWKPHTHTHTQTTANHHLPTGTCVCISYSDQQLIYMQSIYTGSDILTQTHLDLRLLLLALHSQLPPTTSLPRVTEFPKACAGAHDLFEQLPIIYILLEHPESSPTPQPTTGWFHNQQSHTHTPAHTSPPHFTCSNKPITLISNIWDYIYRCDTAPAPTRCGIR